MSDSNDVVLESRYIEPFAKNIAATTCFEVLEIAAKSCSLLDFSWILSFSCSPVTIPAMSG
jgi:hypothetical protein